MSEQTQERVVVPRPRVERQTVQTERRTKVPERIGAVLNTLRHDDVLSKAIKRGTKWGALAETAVVAIPGLDLGGFPIGEIAGAAYEFYKDRKNIINAWKTGRVQNRNYYGMAA